MWAAGSHVSAACAAPGLNLQRSRLVATVARPSSRLGVQSGSSEGQPCRTGLAAVQQHCGVAQCRTSSSRSASGRPAGRRQGPAAAAAAPPASTEDPELPPASSSGDRSHDTDVVIIGSGIGGAGLVHLDVRHAKPNCSCVHTSSVSLTSPARPRLPQACAALRCWRGTATESRSWSPTTMPAVRRTALRCRASTLMPAPPSLLACRVRLSQAARLLPVHVQRLRKRTW